MTDLPRNVAVPELGPLLGRLLRPSTAEGSAALLDDLRIEMLSALFGAAGRARTAAGREGPAAARAVLGHPTWLRAFRHAAEETAGRTGAEMERRIRVAARVARMPDRLAAHHLPTAPDRQALLHRMVSAGIPLERMAPPEDAEPWPIGLRHSAAALEASWERLEQFVDDELIRNQAVVRSVHAWRRPRAPLWILTGAVLGLALYLGLVVGGLLPAPGVLAALRAVWWSLPWP